MQTQSQQKEINNVATPKSGKAKGRRLQNHLRDKLIDAFGSLSPDDIKSQTMGMPGEDIVLSPAAKQTIRYSFECKNKERMSIWEGIDQAKTNAEDRVPVLVIKKNRRNPYAVINLEAFIDLIKE